MNLPLRTKAIIGELLPGFFSVATITALYAHEHINQLGWISNVESSGGFFTFVILVFFAASWSAGAFFDAIRNAILEEWLDKIDIPKIDWEYFYAADGSNLKNLEDWYFGSYQTDWNFVIAILTILILLALRVINLPAFMPILFQVFFVVFSIAVIYIFSLDALSLRGEIAGYIDHHKRAQ